MITGGSRVIVRVWGDNPAPTGRDAWATAFHVTEDCGQLRGIRKNTRSKGVREQKLTLKRAVGLGWTPCRRCASDEAILALVESLPGATAVGLAVEKLRQATDLDPTADPDLLARRVARLRSRGQIADPKGSKHPKRVPRPGGYDYQRLAAVVAWAEQEANGRCVLCGDLAPFTRRDGRPYLEVHHVRHLANRGSDRKENVVALCPNCHRFLHCAGPDEQHRQVSKLYELASWLVRE